MLELILRKRDWRVWTALGQFAGCCYYDSGPLGSVNWAEFLVGSGPLRFSRTLFLGVGCLVSCDRLGKRGEVTENGYILRGVNKGKTQSQRNIVCLQVTTKCGY
jgi:hypothetical protein